MLKKTITLLMCMSVMGASASYGIMHDTEYNMKQTTISTTVSATQDTIEGATALKSNIKNMNLTGYVGTNIKNNVKFWQVSAYKNNKNIIDQIARAKTNTNGFENILGTDYFGVDKYFDIDIADKYGGKSMSWTLKSVPSDFGDRDIRFANDPAAQTNFTGAKELWIKIDASDTSSPTGVRTAFEENVVGRESYRLKNGVSVTLHTASDSTVVATDGGGYIPMPAGFDGYVSMPLDETHFTRYFNEGGNGKLDLSAVVQFQLSVKGDVGMIGKTLYMDEFAIVGDVDGKALPVSGGGNDTYKVVWDMSALSAKSDYDASSLPWYGEFAGKLLTGIAYSYKIYPNAELKTAADEIVTDLKTAQGDDGYLGVFVGGARYSISVSNWDLWNQYHCITGLLEWHKLTGNADALTVAKKAIDCIYETFKDRSYIVAGGFETNRGIAHGYAQMYQATKDVKYLNEAERIIQNDCMDENGWYKTALRGGHFYQTSSNRWEVLHMIMTLGILYEETGNGEYYNVMSQIWEDILQTDIHNGGGFTTDESAQGDPYREGVIETCCTISWLAFTNEYYKYNKSVAVADEFERSYYNAMLGSLLDTDKYCTYNTPMNGVQGSCGYYDGRRVTSQQDISFQYNSGSPDMNCCQANLARGLGQLSEWAAVSDGDKLYLNYFGNSKIETEVSGKNVAIRQTTTYPVTGDIALEITDLSEPTEFSLMIRIPSWAHGSVATVDGVRNVLDAGEYYEVRKIWRNGDRLDLDLEIPFMFWTGEKAQNTFTSVYRGPILLTLDSHFASDKTQQNTVFEATSFEYSDVASGTAGGCMLFCDVHTASGTVRLVDFASAGKYNGASSPSTYWSWLRVSGNPGAMYDAHQRWMNSDKIRIDFGAEIVPERTAYYPGETVRFKLAIPNDCEVSDILGGDILEITSDGDSYTFVMPDEPVTVNVRFKQSGIGDPPKDESSALKISLISVGSVLGAAAIGIGVVFIIKKRKRAEKK